MDEYVKQSIDTRRNAFSASYEISAEMQKKIDKLFSQIEELGLKCKDVGEFEAEFSKSPLNQQYLDLFTEIATGATAKNSMAGDSVAAEVKGSAAKDTIKGVAGGMAESAVERAKSRVLPTRAAVHQKTYDVARDIPVVGDAIDVGQKASYIKHLGKLFRGKK